MIIEDQIPARLQQLSYLIGRNVSQFIVSVGKETKDKYTIEEVISKILSRRANI
jgi:hypothetical protein